MDGGVALLIMTRTIVTDKTPVFCGITLWLGIFTYWMSISIFCFMSVHLLVVVRRLDLPNAWMQPNTAPKVLLGMWIISILVWSGMFIPLVYISYQNYANTNTCLLQLNMFTISSNVAISSIFYALWLAIIVINLISIKLLRAKIRQFTVLIVPTISMPNSGTRTTLMPPKVRRLRDSLVIVGVTSGVFTICILPAFAITTWILMSAEVDEGRNTAHQPVSFILMFINSCSNIFIYYWRIDIFRERFKSMFWSAIKFFTCSMCTRKCRSQVAAA